MIPFHQTIAFSLGAAAVLVLAGCGDNPGTTEPLMPVEQVPQTLESTFKNATPEASQAAKDIAAAVRAEEPQALAELQELSVRPDLDKAQRVAAARAMAAYLQKMRESADKGNKKSEEALQQYRATK